MTGCPDNHAVVLPGGEQVLNLAGLTNRFGLPYNLTRRYS
jgi:hypothetical protein